MDKEKNRIKAELKHKVSFDKANFKKIINFYLIECPVEGKSFRGSTFKEKGWKSSRFTTLKSEMLKNASPQLKKNYHPAKKDELENFFNQCEKLHNEEYAVFLKTDEKRVISSLYSAIRNAFAHGSFDVRTYNKKTVYFFANYHKYLKAKIVLNETTLLNWIKIFNSIK